MWLINFHLGFSVLLLAAYIGIVCMFWKDIKKKIRGLKPKKKGVNIITLLSLLFVIVANKEDLEIVYNYGEDQE